MHCAPAGKSGRDPQTVEERTAALLLERVCHGDLRPERLDPVQVNGTYHCPYCFRVKADDSAVQGELVKAKAAACARVEVRRAATGHAAATGHERTASVTATSANGSPGT